MPKAISSLQTTWRMRLTASFSSTKLWDAASEPIFLISSLTRSHSHHSFCTREMEGWSSFTLLMTSRTKLLHGGRSARVWKCCLCSMHTKSYNEEVSRVGPSFPDINVLKGIMFGVIGVVQYTRFQLNLQFENHVTLCPSGLNGAKCWIPPCWANPIFRHQYLKQTDLLFFF